MASRNFKTPENRDQSALLPPRLDDYVTESNHVRAIDCYVEHRDLESLGFQLASGGLKAGQPAYHPKELAKLYIYGYLHKSRSSRHLENEACRNLELIWLLGNLQPSHATIANFRKNNADALVALNKDFLLTCKEMALFGGTSIAIDGSYFRANASKDGIVTQGKLANQISGLEERIKEWQEKLDDCDKEEASTQTLIDTKKDLSESLEKMKEKLNAKKQIKQDLSDSDETQFSKVDPDARLLTKRGQTTSAYNVQIAVDDKHKLIIASDVTNDGNDYHQLAPMASQAKENLGVDTLDCYADSGYSESQQIKTCEDAGITPYVPLQDKTKHKKKAGFFTRSDFIFNNEDNAYTCPNNAILEQYKNTTIKNGKALYRFGSKESVCRECPFRASCLGEKTKIKVISRWEHEEVLERHKQRMAENPDAMTKRAALVEHPFGTLKRRAGWDHFLVRGFKKVRGEWSLMAMCYNWTRAMNVLGMDKFMEVCKRRAM